MTAATSTPSRAHPAQVLLDALLRYLSGGGVQEVGEGVREFRDLVHDRDGAALL